MEAGIVRALYHRIRSGSSFLRVRRRVVGAGNTIEFSDAVLTRVRIDIIGENNSIRIGKGCRIDNLDIRVRGNRNRIVVGHDCRVSQGGSFWQEDCDTEISIGENTTFGSVRLAATEDHSRILIGRDCMFSSDIDVVTGDSHSILDASTRQRINTARDVTIGDHVWIAARCVILKGVAIGANSVVGAGSVVSSASGEQNVIIAGNPASVIASDIAWIRERI